MSSSRWLFGAAVFLAAFLLFLVEPIASKQLLPLLGGSAAVWITCLVFFQTALLCAYLYAHWLSRRSLWNLHLLLLLLATAAAITWAARSYAVGVGAERPITTVFVALSTWIGVPFLILGATSPLLQVWWARVESGKIPYRLFALSNLASLLALALYPIAIEPFFTLQAQRIAWTCGFAAFAALSVILVQKTRAIAVASGSPQPHEHEDAPPAPLLHKVLWVLLPMGAAMQLSAVTSYLTANVAPIPLLWILPLAAYLITIILAFQFPGLLARGLVTRLLLVLLGSLAYMMSKTEVSLPLRISILFFLIEIFVAGYFCHAETVALRPRRPSESTLFYLLFAAGGALGSSFIGIAFPLIFRFNYDLPITFLVTALLAFVVTWRGGWSQRLLWAVASGMMALLVSWVHIASLHDTIAAARNFYGTLRVRQDHGYPGSVRRVLTNGTIQHGTQYFGTEKLRRTPTSYYAEDSGIGLAVRFCCTGRARNIGVIGLGSGTMAAYGRPGDRVRFYEINPAVAPIANNVFTYIRDSGAQVSIAEGDGRLSMLHENPQGFDVLVVDAFSGDAIPLHLLTTQAVALYRKHLAPGGIIAFHISNQHVNLEPPIALLAKAAGMTAMVVATGPNDEIGEFGATWVLVSDDAAFFAQPEVAAKARPARPRPGLKLWTDDYSSLLPVLHW
ncbi:MAG TPA: fused MFS/spermidine synthase [Terracidiphilus sp.]|nr:fused MFS/spermidine synthase [Terracidiphilus sp.]